MARMTRFLPPLAVALLLSACVSPGSAPSGTRTPVAVPRYPVVGLEGVLGQTANALTRSFGQPNQDVREGGARKLQFVSPFCVLDTYLYPKGGGGDSFVAHVDARQLDGRDIDRASCVASMQRRHGGK
jgi:hypothetical protein